MPRQFNKIIKEQAWEELKIHPRLDKKYFRIDCFGKLIAKVMSKKNPSEDYKKLMATTDHWVPYSSNGQSTKRNLVWMSFYINQFKADKYFADINKVELQEKINECIDAEEFVKGLDKNIYDMNDKYGIDFIKQGTIYTILNDETRREKYKLNLSGLDITSLFQKQKPLPISLFYSFSSWD